MAGSYREIKQTSELRYGQIQESLKNLGVPSFSCDLSIFCLVKQRLNLGFCLFAFILGLLQGIFEEEN